MKPIPKIARKASITLALSEWVDAINTPSPRVNSYTLKIGILILRSMLNMPNLPTKSVAECTETFQYLTQLIESLMMFNESCHYFSGVVFSHGRYWKELRRFLLRNLRDFGFGKSSMEDLFHDEMAKLCQKLAKSEGQPIDLVAQYFILKHFVFKRHL